MIIKSGFKVEDLSQENITYLLSTRDIHRETLENLNSFGEVFTEKVKTLPPARLNVLFFDVLQRIACYVHNLTILPTQACNVSSQRLILRSIFSDLILAYAILSKKNKAEQEKLCLIIDYSGIKKLLTHFKLEKELYENVSTPAVDPETLSNIIRTREDELASIKQQLGVDKVNTALSNISSLAECIKNSETEDIPKYFYHILYSPFVILSQTEHYSVSNRFGSYLDSTEFVMFELYAKKIKVSIEYLINAYRHYFDIPETK